MSIDHLKPKTNRGIQTRNKLLRSAEYIFGKNGYHQSSITEITQNAGVSLGNFYTYFESKYQIFEALIWEMQRELLLFIKERTEGIDNRIEIERAGFKALFEFVKKRPYWYSLFPQAEFVDKELHRKTMEKFAKSYINRIEESMEKGEIRSLNSEMLVYSFMGITNYLGMKWILWDGKEIDDKLIDDIMDFVKFGISAP
ncbi:MULTISPECIES: TetR/AcrR family transcriptional regulator [Bacillaceae]|uniref:TetR/AcrR family transcriptional regulator n=1 Tax=Bacillaceae TaxID=186817 RepID=UPI00082A7C79|nr:MULTISPECIES: TetR/AcrR family transcriptional regulator [Bacillaceae]MCM3766170.1 TetR/AcrR family transcriptional regulator [Neobacillus niacini]